MNNAKDNANQPEYVIEDNILSITNSNDYDKVSRRELDTPNKGKFEVSLNGNYTDKQLMDSPLSKGITGSKLMELIQFINTQQPEGVNSRPAAVISADAVYTPFAGTDRNGRQMDVVRNETYENEVEIDGKSTTQVVHRSWFTLTSIVPRKAVSIKNFSF